MNRKTKIIPLSIIIFWNFISNIKNLYDLNEIGFDYQLKKLFALFKDSHTSYFVSGQSLIKDRILFVQNDFYYQFQNQDLLSSHL